MRYDNGSQADGRKLMRHPLPEPLVAFLRRVTRRLRVDDAHDQPHTCRESNSFSGRLLWNPTPR